MDSAPRRASASQSSLRCVCRLRPRASSGSSTPPARAFRQGSEGPRAVSRLLDRRRRSAVGSNDGRAARDTSSASACAAVSALKRPAMAAARNGAIPHHGVAAGHGEVSQMHHGRGLQVAVWSLPLGPYTDAGAVGPGERVGAAVDVVVAGGPAAGPSPAAGHVDLEYLLTPAESASGRPAPARPGGDRRR